MSYCCNKPKRFSSWLITCTITALLVAAMVITFLMAAWRGVSYELCARDLPQREYKEMQLDCRAYGFDRQ